MRNTAFLLIMSLFWATAWDTQAQMRCESIAPGTEAYFLQDSMILDPVSITVSPHTAYRYMAHLQKLEFSKPLTEEVQVCFNVLPVNIKKTYANRSADLYDSTAAFQQIYPKSPQLLAKEQLFSSSRIYTNGSLTRGISFGNRQNVGVISSFNFQMDGELTDNLNIRADITDQNVPFQPEGNTQQIREFDNITFEVYNDKLSLKAGDLVLTNPDSYFLKYYKNVLGGSFDVKYNLADSISGESFLAVSAAKGQFVDVTIKSREGQQGPYQLQGPIGQNFVIVLANSEKVYVDGKLLKRGYNYDYTIDYNLGELTFNPNVLITQFTRIRVTYEYVDQNYSRSIIAAHQSVDFKKLDFDFGYYREKDDINRPLAFLLSQDDKIQMSNAGDDQIPVPIGSEVSADFSRDRVLYIRRDTVDLDDQFQSIFSFSRDSLAELYQVSFTNVGSGNGDYVLAQNDVNGRVYQWVSPQSGQSQGEYAPIRFVPAPNQRQMVVVGGKYHITPYLDLYAESAFSNHDLNLFSDLDSDDDKDAAYKVGLALEQYPVNFLHDYHLSAYLNYENDGKDFNPIDRFRVIEFDRNWSYNAQLDTFRTADNIFHVGGALQKDARNVLKSRYSLRRKEFAIDGYQQDYSLEKDLGDFHVSAGLFDMKNENLREASTWQRWHAEAFFDPFFVVPGYRISEDRNEVFVPGTDSLVRTAMNFSAHQFYLRSHDTLRVRYRIDHTIREDQAVSNGEMVPFTTSNTSSANLSTPAGRDHYLNLTATYREVKYKTGFENLEDEKLILGRLLARNTFFDRHITTDLNYATSSSQEILREYVYVQVTPGEGTHTWRDLNGDGVQELTEFFEAINFDERNYIRVFVPTNEFVDAFSTLFTLTFNAEMPSAWRTGHGLRKLLGNVSTRTNLNINKKNTNDDFNSRFNPFSLDIEDSELIFSRDALRSTLFYNRSGRGMGADYTYSVSRAKQSISRGIDSRFQRDQLLNIRYHLGSEWTLTARIGNSLNRNASQFNEDRSFRIRSDQLGPGLIWQPTANLRFSTNYLRTRKHNLDAEAREVAELDELTLENRWSNGFKNSMSTRFTYTNIAFDGDENTAAAYELLNALRPGDNYAWMINYSQKLVSGLQMSLSYEGRKSVDNPTIHLGRVQITALF